MCDGFFILTDHNIAFECKWDSVILVSYLNWYVILNGLFFNLTETINFFLGRFNQNSVEQNLFNQKVSNQNYFFAKRGKKEGKKSPERSVRTNQSSKLFSELREQPTDKQGF